MNGSHKSAISEHFRGHSEHGLQKIEKKTVRGVASPPEYLFGLKFMYEIPIFYQFSLGF